MTTIAPRRDSRLLAYATIAIGCLGLGLLSGEPEPIALAAGLTAVLMLGVYRIEPITVTSTIEVEARRLIEGDPVAVDLALDHPPDHRLDVVLTGTSLGLGEVEYRFEPTVAGRTLIHVGIATPEWGRHDLGHLTVRAHSPGAMSEWEQRVIDLGEVTVLPRPAHLTSLLSPRATQASSGWHPAKVFTGDGSEFIDIRAYAPGDRARDINWKATAKRGAPQVNRRLTERGGDVVIVLDATSDGWRQSELGTALLQRAGEAVWGLARTHLAAQDRVGLLTQKTDGVEWLPPDGGVRARYRVLETLLGANTSSRPLRMRATIQRHDIPPAALVIGVSALRNNLTLRSLAAMRAHGRAVGVLAIDAAVMLHASEEELDASTLRLATMMFDAHVAYVRRLGLPIVTWRPGEDLDRAITRLADHTRRSVRTGATG